MTRCAERPEVGASTTVKNRQDPLDLASVRPWLAQCGHCDAGLPMDCTCPQGDPRTVIAQLVVEVKRLRAAARRAQREHIETLRRADDAARRELRTFAQKLREDAADPSLMAEWLDHFNLDPAPVPDAVLRAVAALAEQAAGPKGAS